MVYERNVVILGKVGSGKKTLGNHIAGTTILQRESVFGNVGHYYGVCEREDTLYRIQTVDTGGLPTGYQDPMPYIKKFQTIHLIMFVIANGRYTDESHRSLTIAIDSLPRQAKSLCALVITHCEGLTEEQQRDIVAEFERDARTAQVTAMMGKGIFTVGFPDISKLPRLLKAFYQIRINADDRIIRRLMNGCNYGLNINALQAQAVRQHQPLFSKPSASISHYRQTSTKPSLLHREASPFNQGASPFRQRGASPFHQLGASPFHQIASPFHKESSRFHSDRLLSTVSVENRCVVVLGKSGAGKSTVANMVIGHDPLSKAEPPFLVSSNILQSVTDEVGHETAEFRRGGILYRLKLIDTVGIFGTQAEGSHIILEKMEEYIKGFTDGINLFLFIFKKGRFTQEEQDVFSFIRSKFKCDISPVSALAVTACEQDPPAVRDQFIQEFQSDPATHNIALQMQLGIYPVGFPSLKEMNPELQSIHRESMEQDRDTLLNLIIRSSRVHLTRNLFQESVKPVTNYRPRIRTHKIMDI